MITKINSTQDALNAFNENLEGLLSGKRKLPIVKEVNNTIGKYGSFIKMELMHKAITGDKTPLAWFAPANLELGVKRNENEFCEMVKKLETV